MQHTARHHLLHLVASLLAANLLSGCGGGEAPLVVEPLAPHTFSVARQAWTSLALPAYRFTLATACFCITESEIEVTVRDGKVSSAVYVDTRTSVSPERLLALPTLTVLFDIGNDAYARHAAEVRFAPNARYGFLESIYIDYDVQMADEERGYQVSGFTVLTP
ncbi:DUF6174 domain-containing protein [Sphaerotilus sp.]|uniref:DUF6174 domain-containing protein n=1 Tax=Sphaerotilus sp. TaxID=2093942 RepID=UPI0025EC90F8|nr:DUF6174 domain-containing protein [Sphaerotilus sp.]